MRLITGIVLSVGTICGVMAAQDEAASRGFARYSEIPSHFAPAWSPDDSKLVYETAMSGPGGALFVVPATGGKPVRLLQDDDRWSGGAAAWSPNGHRIAFMWNHDGRPRLWTSDSSGGDIRQVTKATSGFQGQPSWSPDGKQLAYVSLPGQRIMILSESGGEPKQFATGVFPRWSPDGKRIAYVSRAFLTDSICVKDVEGGVPNCLASTRVPANEEFPLVASWSPDGKRLVSGKVVNGRPQLALIDVAEDRVERLIATSGAAAFPAWSHDGGHIAYTLTDTGNPGEIHTITPDGKHDAQVTAQRRYLTAKLIRYTSADGLSVPAWLYEPRRPQGGRSAIVWLHGFPDVILEWFDRRVQYFVDHGFTVLAPNYRGTAGFDDKLEQTRLLGAALDVTAAVQYLRSQAGIDPGRIAAAGFSMGASIALLATCGSPRLLACVIDFHGPTDMAAQYSEHPDVQSSMVATLGGTPSEEPQAYRSVSPIACVDKIQAPLMILHGDQDDRVRISHSVRLAEALKSAKKQHEFLTFPGASHGFHGADLVRACDAVLRFLSTRLPGPKAGVEAEQQSAPIRSSQLGK